MGSHLLSILQPHLGFRGPQGGSGEREVYFSFTPQPQEVCLGRGGGGGGQVPTPEATLGCTAGQGRSLGEGREADAWDVGVPSIC